MTKENNTPANLTNLLVSKKITLKQYFFRQGAENLKINTYKDAK